MQTPPRNGGTPPGTWSKQQPVSPARNDVYFHTESKGGGGRCTAGLVQNSQAEVGSWGGVTKTQVGTWDPLPMSPFPAAGWLLPRARPARDVFGSTKRGVRGRQGAEGGSLSYKTRSQQALRNKSRVPEQPTLPPRTDRRWEGGGAASEPAGLLLPWLQPGGRLRVSPPPRAEEIPAVRSDPGAECSRGGGSGAGGLGGGLGSPALRLAGTGGAAGGATCAVPGVLLVVPPVVGEGVPGARGAVGESGVTGGDKGLHVPSTAWLLSTTPLRLQRELR